MKKIKNYTTWFSILLIAFSLTGSVQAQIGIWKEGPMIRIGKKPKDFNSPPDPNEYQKPVNGEFRANPLFFAAKDDKERCQAIDLWLSSVRYEVNQVYARSTYYRQNTEYDMEQIRGNEVPQFATPGFRNIFGKPLPELSEKETKQIGKFLDKCTTQRWVATYLEPLFQSPYPNQMGEWFRNFANYEAALQQAKIQAEKENYRQKYQTVVSSSGYPIAELLKETDSYRLHASFLSNGDVQWCSNDQAVVGLIFKANENFRVENNDQYWQLFESEILPAVKSICPAADKVYVLNYVNGFYINFDQNKINTSPIYNYPSNMLNVGVYAGSTKSRSWMGGSNSFGGSGYTGGRRQNITRLENADSNAAPSFASIANLRIELQGRQAKLDEEARIRREQAAAAEAARIAEVKRQEEARIAQKRAGDRGRAADVLKYYKKGALKTYDFAGYSQKEGLEKIYNGDFESFTGKYTSEAQLNVSPLKSFWESLFDKNVDRAITNVWNNTVDVTAVAERRNFLKMAFYAYHTTYAEVCRTNRDMVWDSNVFTWVTRDGYGNKKGETEPISLPVRIPFEKLYNSILENNIGKNGNKALFRSPEVFDTDFRKLIKAEGCASASIRHFETNLYLANEWLLPAQELMKP